MGRIVRKFLGVNIFDIGYRESFFKEMAKKGLILKEMGRFFAKFEESDPVDTEYRIKALTGYNDYSDEPANFKADSAKEFEKYGWEMVDIQYSYFIYRCVDMDDFVEMPVTETEYQRVESLTHRPLFLMLLNALPILILAVVGIGFIEGYAMLFNNWVVIFIWTAAVLFALTFYEVIRVRKLKRKYKYKLPIDHYKDWKKVRRKKRIAFLIAVLLILIGVVFFVVTAVPSAVYKLDEDFESKAKILRLSDIENQTLEENDENNITVSSSLLVPVRYELYEKDDVSDKSLEVKYYELELKFLSKMVRKELTEFWLNPDFNYHQLQSDVFDSAIVCEMNSSVEFYIENGSRVIHVDYRGDKTTEQLFEVIEKSLGEHH